MPENSLAGVDDFFDRVAAGKAFCQKRKEFILGILKHREAQLLLAGEVVVQIAFFDPGGLDDRADAGVVKSLGHKDFPGRLEDMVAGFFTLAGCGHCCSLSIKNKLTGWYNLSLFRCIVKSNLAVFFSRGISDAIYWEWKYATGGLTWLGRYVF